MPFIKNERVRHPSNNCALFEEELSIMLTYQEIKDTFKIPEKKCDFLEESLYSDGGPPVLLFEQAHGKRITCHIDARTSGKNNSRHKKLIPIRKKMTILHKKNSW